MTDTTEPRWEGVASAAVSLLGQIPGDCQVLCNWDVGIWLAREWTATDADLALRYDAGRCSLQVSSTAWGVIGDAVADLALTAVTELSDARGSRLNPSSWIPSAR